MRLSTSILYNWSWSWCYGILTIFYSCRVWVLQLYSSWSALSNKMKGLSFISHLGVNCHCIIYTCFQTVTIYEVSFIKCTSCTRSPVSLGFGKQNMHYLSNLCYNSSLVTWTVISLTASKFKPLICSMYGFALSYGVNICIVIDLYDFCWNFESHVQFVHHCAPRKALPFMLGKWLLQ
jgi:hypothetical protein